MWPWWAMQSKKKVMGSKRPREFKSHWGLLAMFWLSQVWDRNKVKKVYTFIRHHSHCLCLNSSQNVLMVSSDASRTWNWTQFLQEAHRSARGRFHASRTLYNLECTSPNREDTWRLVATLPVFSKFQLFESFFGQNMHWLTCLHLLAGDSLVLGRDLEIQLDVRPASDSGLLLYAGTSSDQYLSLFLSQGEVS